MNDNSLYRQDVLEHYRNPQNFGALPKPTVKAYYINPLCGDEIDLQILLDKKNKIKDVRFSGSGCVLSIASASLFTENLKGKSLSQLKKIKSQKLIKNLGISVSAARRKCVLLPYDALQEILKNTPSNLPDGKAGSPA